MILDKKVIVESWHRIDSGAHLFGQISRLTVRMTYLMATLMLCTVSAADYFTGIELMMSPMYAFPCLLMDWRIGRAQALIYAMGASGVQWLIGTVGGRPYSHASYVYWDILLNIVFYGSLVWVVAKLRLALEMERMLSRVDFLTRLANRETLCEALNLEIQRSRRYGHNLAIVTMDCDQFKQFNEQRGHSTGDLVLQAVADSLLRKFHGTDLVARSGSDEFMVVLPQTPSDQLDAVLNALRTDMDNMMLMRGWTLTFSYACSVFPCPPDEVSKLFRQHANIMQQAKLDGNNTIARRIWEAEEGPFASSALGNLSGQQP